MWGLVRLCWCVERCSESPLPAVPGPAPPPVLLAPHARALISDIWSLAILSMFEARACCCSRRVALPNLMYFMKASLLHLPCLLISSSEYPARAIAVASPARKEWEEMVATS